MIPTTAAAEGGDDIEVSVDGGPFTTSPTGSLIQVANLAPGIARTAVLGIKNPADDDASVHFQFVDAEFNENGCVRPELALDPRCNPEGPGQLRRSLVFRLAVSGSRDGPFDRVWSGSAATLEKSGVTMGPALAAHTAKWVRITTALPWESGNETQSDTYKFAVKVTLST
jgi:hypothetical protein